MSATQDYERLLALCVCELELARAGRLDELAAIEPARAAILATLPGVPPPDARESLERSLTITRHVDVELRRQRDQAVETMRGLRRAGRAADGYAARGARTPVIQTDA